VLSEVAFGEWTPDKASSKSNHLATAVNVRPIVNGYAPVSQFSAITTDLGEAFNGGAAFVGSDGTAALLAGTATKLRKYSAGWTTIITDAAVARWRFTQFGDNVLMANGGELLTYNLVSGVTDRLVGTDAPTNAIDVATVRDFVMALLDDNNAQWSQFNDSANWAIGTSQADKQPLLDGGAGVAIVGGEYGLIFQKRAIKRVSYVGSANDIIFQFDTISAEIGCMTQGSVCSVGKLVGFLSERGFMVCDGESVKPVGDEKFNRFFFNTYSREQIESGMWSAIDPRNSLMLWGVTGVPGKIIAFNWVLNRAAVIEMRFTGLFSGFTSNISLEALDALYPGGLDTMDKSLDDPSFRGGNPLLLIADDNNAIGTLSGANMAASLRIENIELSPAKRSRITGVRPVSDATDLAVTVDARMRPADTENVKTCGSMRGNGRMPVRANGRYATIDVTIPAGAEWNYIQGLEFEFERGDGR
jgi:hypothetical protein